MRVVCRASEVRKGLGGCLNVSARLSSYVCEAPMEGRTVVSPMYQGASVAPLAITVPLGISIQEFSTIMVAIGGLYREVGKALGTEEVTGLQVSRHREGSLVLECDPLLKDGSDPSAANSVTDVLLQELEALAIGSRSASFSQAALKHAAKLTGAFTDEGSQVVVSSGSRSVSFGVDFRSTVLGLVNRTTVSWGSVEGTLQMISLRGPSRFNLHEMLTDEKVECRFDADMLETARASLGYRVVVSGEIHKRGGKFEYVKVERLHARPPSDQLPGFAEIRGLFADA